MDHEMVIERLNDLLELEARSMLRRLHEAQPFVDWVDAEAVPAFERIVADEYEHQRRLCEAIIALGGTPRPPTLDMRTAGFHYLNARYLLPLVIEDQRERVGAYEQALTDVSASREALAVATEILARRRAHLRQLEALSERFAPAPSAKAEPVSQDDEP